MEWVEGRTLEDELRARRQQGGRHPFDAMSLLRPIFEAVAVAHDAGIAHRDLKPANIMVMRSRRTTTARLLDFGIAKLMEPDEEAGSGFTRTSSTRVAFSPRYAAPEQLSSARTGPWSDVHALGMILSEVLTDAAGYAGNDTTAVFAEALSPTRPSPAKHRVDVGAWEPVLCKALAMRPDDRYANAGDFLAALDAALPDATHPASPALDAPLSTTGPRGLSSSASRERSLVSAEGAPRCDDAPPSIPDAGDMQALPPSSSSGTQVLSTPDGSSTLRGVSSAPLAPTASVGRRGPAALVAVVAAVVTLSVVAIVRSRSAAPQVASTSLTAVRPSPAIDAATPIPAVVAPVRAAVAEPAPVAPAISDAGGVPAAPVAAPEAPRRRARRTRTPSGPNTSPERYDIE
jgi:serine/threonine protein kinase